MLGGGNGGGCYFGSQKIFLSQLYHVGLYIALPQDFGNNLSLSLFGEIYCSPLLSIPFLHLTKKITCFTTPPSPCSDRRTDSLWILLFLKFFCRYMSFFEAIGTPVLDFKTRASSALWAVHTKSHRMAIGWTLDIMGSVPNFSNGWNLFLKDSINGHQIWVFYALFFLFIMLCYIFFFVNVALSILSKSNLHPFCI